MMSRIVQRFRKVADLSPSDQLLLVRIILSLWFFRVALWVVPFSTFYRLLHKWYDQPSKRSAVSGRKSPVSPEKIGWLVSGASRVVPRPTCLVRASVAYVYLKRWGIPAELKIGVKRSTSNEFLAHAWVLSDGIDVVGGAEAKEFTVLPLSSSHAA